MSDNGRRIFKYRVPIGGEHTIELSIFGDIVHVDLLRADHRGIAFWAMNYPPTTVRRGYTFRVFATDEPVPVGWKHMGSAADRAGSLMWHLFVQGVDCRRLP